MAYIIPSNFLFGDAISNKIRDDLLDAYTIGRRICSSSRFLSIQACM